MKSSYVGRLPEISIITVTLNDRLNLENCIRYAEPLREGVPAAEHIIIDDCSSDGTKDMLNGMNNHSLQWVSEPDQGIASAMNKGISMAKGNWLIFINADDELLMNELAIESLFNSIRTSSSRIHFHPVVATGGGEPDTLVSPLPHRLWRKIPCCHQGMVIHRSAFERLGGYDESFQICMDYEWIMRAHRAGWVFSTYPSPFAKFSRAGRSSSKNWTNQKARFIEERRVHLMHAGSISQRWIYHLYWAFYLPYRRLHSLKTGGL